MRERERERRIGRTRGYIPIGRKPVRPNADEPKPFSRKPKGRKAFGPKSQIGRNK